MYRKKCRYKNGSFQKMSLIQESDGELFLDVKFLDRVAELLEGDGLGVVGVGLLHHPDGDGPQLLLGHSFSDHPRGVLSLTYTAR